MSEKDANGWEMPTVWIQYKGTDICFDFHCECGREDMGHYDGYGAYAVQCSACGRKYDLPQTLKLEPFSGKWEPVIAHGDDT